MNERVNGFDVPGDGLGTWAEVGRFNRMVKELRRDWRLQQLGPVVSIKEAKARLGCSTNTVRRLIADGRLNAWKDDLANRVWILVSDLDWLASPGSPEFRKRYPHFASQ